MSTTLKADAKASGTFKIGGDLPVHRLGFGAMRITSKGVWGDPKDPREARAVLREAVKLGINFIDTADSYGPETSELLIAEALRPYKKGLVIATKGGLTRPGPDLWEPVARGPYIQQCVELSLRRLKIDCIDLYQLHRIDPKTPLEETLGALNKLQKAGKICHIGLSEVSVAEIKKARKIAKIASVQNLYNLGDRKHDDVVDYCEKEKLAFIPWFSHGGGQSREERRHPGCRIKETRRVDQPAGTCVAPASLAGHHPDSWHQLGQAPQGKHRRCLAQAERCRVEGNREGGEKEITESRGGLEIAATPG